MSSAWSFRKEIEKYSFRGTKNEADFPQQFIDIVKMSQTELKLYLEDELGKYYAAGNIFTGNGYIYVRGSYPVALTAHMDTVHDKPVSEFYGFTRKDGTHVISSPQGIGGDDRCGIYMILTILRETPYRPYIIFCEDEEIGGVGSNKFVKTDLFDELVEVKFFIELDRANGDDLVFYDDGNEDFQEWCQLTTGYKTSIGSFSDISHFCPAIGISGVNISCGYYNAHTLDEFVVREEMENGIDAAINLIINAIAADQFEYMDLFKDDYGYKYLQCGDFDVQMEFDFWNDETGTEDIAYATGESQLSCIAQFLMDNPRVAWEDVMDYHML